MKIKALDTLTYNIDGTPNGRRSVEKGETVDLPGRFAIPFVAQGKAEKVGNSGTKAKPPTAQKTKGFTFKKHYGWIQQYQNGVKIDSMREDEFKEKFPNEEVPE